MNKFIYLLTVLGRYSIYIQYLNTIRNFLLISFQTGITNVVSVMVFFFKTFRDIFS